MSSKIITESKVYNFMIYKKGIINDKSDRIIIFNKNYIAQSSKKNNIINDQ